MYDYKEWRHVFKVDPNKEIEDSVLEEICESGTDAILVGGSDGVTLDNTISLLARIRRYTVPCVLEVSNIESITPGFDFYFIPTVLNTDDMKWMKGLHHEAVKEYGEIMNWDEIVMEGYCILNEEAKAAKLTRADTNLDRDDILAYARMAEKMFKLPIFYLEYSGTYGEPELVREVSSVLEEAQLFYGGGISSQEQAEEMAKYAKTIVVGNIIYEDVKEALKTVKAVK
ncbi:heptaprenylglyceryl phosphate synthase [Bacillus taeanensis]|uniref:Heptaprenylglyceryl phosphate synthase n=1 Tax=Bacillus taeanensis TaxID=273032 RepID=A0A366Y371_9BACI|nr:heptaprenylglyceryl phosphate synthase [Bacillus taeanensis]RBW70834.1 heptaprenylglyceryl phosphate synthase [Bacillus taeanensis]